MKLACQAYDRTGRLVEEVLDAASESEAAEQLRRQGLLVTRVTPAADAPAARAPARWWPAGSRIRQVMLFTRQLHVLLSTGTTVVDALGALERQMRDPRFRAVVAALRSDVEQGAPLAEAMAKHPACFDSVYRALIAAGEHGGQLDTILERLSSMTRRQVQMRNMLRGALIYPILLLGVSVVVLLGMFIFVLPRFALLFESLNVPLPPTTQVLMTLSDAVVGYWWAMLASLLIAAAGAWMHLRTETGRVQRDTLLIRLPFIGSATRGLITARLVRLLGALGESQVPLLDALDFAREAAGNVHYRNLIAQAHADVTQGEPVSRAFRDDRLVSPTVYEAIRSGESTGRVAMMLLNMADFLDEENEVTLKALASILEPIILIALGVLVGGMAMSMFMPLFDLASQAGA